LHFEATLELGLQSARAPADAGHKANLIDGVSFGYVANKATYDREGHRLLSEVDLFEISLVTFRRTTRARVSSVKAEAAGIVPCSLR
jgi:HK97 family phage prohead protease